ncbi:hypothetical protein N7507_001790 [Penicillium longicatenatum]|nr:hypothetical protein N7507_001790 [Penicillium longicatenatum]
MAPKLMKAALCKEPGKPIVIEHIPTPTPTGRDLLVRVEVATLCNSDIGITQSGGFGLSTYPLVIGHEAVCIVEELGPDASVYDFKPGDRIGSPLWRDMCLTCYECTSIGPQFCPSKKLMGLTAPGYFCEYTLVDAACAVKVPKKEGNQAAQLSPLFCAGITVWDALRRAELKDGETVAVVGVGGLGEMGVKYAHAMGCKVLGLDINEEQLSGVLESGVVDGIVNTRTTEPGDVLGAVRELNGGRGVDVVVVTSGALKAYETAIGILRPEGRLIAVGVPLESVPLSMSLMASYAFKIIGAKVPGQIGCSECVAFSHEKGIYPRINPREFQLEDINEMIALLKAGNVQDGRMAIRF